MQSGLQPIQLVCWSRVPERRYRCQRRWTHQAARGQHADAACGVVREREWWRGFDMVGQRAILRLRSKDCWVRRRRRREHPTRWDYDFGQWNDSGDRRSRWRGRRRCWKWRPHLGECLHQFIVVHCATVHGRCRVRFQLHECGGQRGHGVRGSRGPDVSLLFQRRPQQQDNSVYAIPQRVSGGVQGHHSSHRLGDGPRQGRKRQCRLRARDVGGCDERHLWGSCCHVLSVVHSPGLDRHDHVIDHDGPAGIRRRGAAVDDDQAAHDDVRLVDQHTAPEHIIRVIHRNP